MLHILAQVLVQLCNTIPFLYQHLANKQTRTYFQSISASSAEASCIYFTVKPTKKLKRNRNAFIIITLLFANDETRGFVVWAWTKNDGVVQNQGIPFKKKKIQSQLASGIRHMKTGIRRKQSDGGGGKSCHQDTDCLTTKLDDIHCSRLNYY